MRVTHAERVSGQRVGATTVAIDGTEALARHLTGTGVYVRHLVRELFKTDIGPSLRILGIRGVAADFSAIPADRVRLLRTPTYRSVWTQLRLPLHLLAHRYGVLHLPDHKLPFLCPPRSVITVLDLAFMKFPETFKTLHRRRLVWFTKNAVRRADRIIAISGSTQSDLCELLQVPRENIAVIHLGVDHAIYRPDVQPHRRVAPYFLSVGALQPRKNYVFLIRAFKRLCAQYPEEVDLLIVGQRGWLWEPIEEEARKPPFAERIHLLGYVPDEELPGLYAGALAAVFPSLYEGFGIPVVEAMACGCPVIAADRSSFPEVVGEAGILLDPTDELPWVRAMERMLREAEYRSQWSDRAASRSREFSWERTARETLAVYRAVLEANPRGQKG